MRNEMKYSGTLAHCNTPIHKRAMFLSATWFWLSLIIYHLLVFCDAFVHSSCTRSVASQFQFEGCYLPSLDPDVLLSEASFLMSHDAATGYLQANRGASSATNLYAKNQIGTAYDQLQDGARALDLRPKLLQNGTVVMHHGAISIPVSLEQLVQDVVRWSRENPDELVLLLHLKLTYDNGLSPSADTAVEALSSVYESLGVTYVPCDDVYGLTVQDAMDLAQQTSGLNILAMDRQDAYASSCAKMNYIADQIVTCYPTNTTAPCTRSNSPALEALHSYALDSANNDASDNSYDLGPPASIDVYPFFAIQALWQVDTHSAALGVAHLSSIIDDNTKSHINAQVVNWVYEEEFSAISLLLVDHVQLNGNAILSVLRTRCGQMEQDQEDILCGNALSKPKLQQKPMSTLVFFVSWSIYLAFGIWIMVMLRHYKQHYNHEQEMKRIQHDLQQVDQQFQRVMAGEFS